MYVTRGTLYTETRRRARTVRTAAQTATHPETRQILTDLHDHLARAARHLASGATFAHIHQAVHEHYSTATRHAVRIGQPDLADGLQQALTDLGTRMKDITPMNNPAQASQRTPGHMPVLAHTELARIFGRKAYSIRRDIEKDAAAGRTSEVNDTLWQAFIRAGTLIRGDDRDDHTDEIDALMEKIEATAKGADKWNVVSHPVRLWHVYAEHHFGAFED